MYSCADGIVLTGVGRYTDPRRGAFIAPPDPNARWDDPGYEHPDEDEFAVMRRFETNGRRGYIFHDACWSLLQRAFRPAPVPLVRLFEACDSVPLDLVGDALNWGHDYGGLAVVRDADLLPWEDGFTDREFLEEWFDTLYSADPLTIPEVDEILAEPPRAPPGNQSPFTISAAPSGNDPFTLLPVELCSAIAEYLPTPDVLNARLASKSFWQVFYSQQFWASRFRGSPDRSWLFEAVNQKGATSRDWRWLYRCTVDHRLGRALQNRKRIWHLIQRVAVLVELRWNQPPAGLLPEEGREWVLVAGNMVDRQPEGFSHLQQGCWQLRSIRVAIPDGVSQVSAWTVPVGDREYIAGISLDTASGEVLRLGYSRAGGRSSVRLSGLAGFNVAVGLGGIHALQCIDSTTGETSAWLGCPDNAPKTERLALGVRVAALEVGFDVGTSSLPPSCSSLLTLV